MNILIVGNGFDLSHYLPTKYDHFMDVMRAIEAKDTGGLPKNLEEKKIDEWLNLLDKTFQKPEGIALPPHDMAFDELFSKVRDPNFIEKTKEFYLTENIEICAKDVLKLQYRLELNCWYQYFKNHVEKIKTWIDFEQKIEAVLVILAKSMVQIEKVEIDINDQFDLSGTLSKKDIKTLNFFSFSKAIGGRVKIGGKIRITPRQTYVNTKFCHGKNIDNGFSATAFLDFLHQELEKFIEIFNLYLELVINKLTSVHKFSIESEEWINPDQIYSFNYTNTYQKIYDQSAETDYLHGSFGKKQNIVLGVSDLKDESLKKLKVYGFTKYHQKIFNETDYLFLESYKLKVEQHKRKVEYFEKDFGSNGPLVNKKFERQNLMEVDSKLHLNISIWGHSLDLSDQDYIKDIFSLNDDIDRNVRVTVYHFDKPAKFSLLNNLLAILGKDQVERWMKNQWLVFKPNPEIKFGM